MIVPCRPLVGYADKSLGPADLGGNLIIHGDKLTECYAITTVRTRHGDPSWWDYGEDCGTFHPLRG